MLPPLENKQQFKHDSTPRETAHTRREARNARDDNTKHVPATTTRAHEHAKKRAPTKMTHGCSLAASVKIARTRRLASPSHFDMTALVVTLRKKQLLSLASACCRWFGVRN